MITKFIKRAHDLKSKVQDKMTKGINEVVDKFNEDKGGSTIVEVIGLIVVVLVILIVIFYPFISDWFKNTLAPLFTELTQKLFALVG